MSKRDVTKYLRLASRRRRGPVVRADHGDCSDQHRGPDRGGIVASRKFGSVAAVAVEEQLRMFEYRCCVLFTEGAILARALQTSCIDVCFADPARCIV